MAEILDLRTTAFKIANETLGDLVCDPITEIDCAVNFQVIKTDNEEICATWSRNVMSNGACARVTLNVTFDDAIVIVDCNGMHYFNGNDWWEDIRDIFEEFAV